MTLLSLLLIATATAGGADVAAWQARTGLSLNPTGDAQVRVEGDGVVFAARGASLLIAPVSENAGALEAVQSQVGPFTAAGISAPTIGVTECMVGGQAADCRVATLEVAPGASMRIMAAHVTGTDWVAVCLDRGVGPAWAPVCAPAFGG